MKSIAKIGLSLVSCLLVFIACDYIANPLLPKPVVVINDTVVYQNVLLEDYNGETCINCPSASSEIDSLIGVYKTRIIPLSICYGYFATIATGYPANVAPYKTWDFTTPVGNTYGNLFLGPNASYPDVMVNRMHAPTGQNNFNSNQVFADSVVAIMNANTGPANIKLILNTTFNSGSRVLTVKATATFLKAYPGNYNIVLLLTQDSIKGPQLLAGVPDTSYQHRFLLRDNITSSAGGDVFVPVGGASINQVFNTTTYSYNLQTAYPQSPATGCHQIPCDYTKCYVVAFIYDALSTSPTYYQVMQAQQKKIYP